MFSLKRTCEGNWHTEKEEEDEEWDDGETNDPDMLVDKDQLIGELIAASRALGLSHTRASLASMNKAEFESVIKEITDRKEAMPSKPNVKLLSRQQMLETLLLYKKRLPDYIRGNPDKMKWLVEEATKEEICELFEDHIFSWEPYDERKIREAVSRGPRGLPLDDPDLSVNIEAAPAVAELKEISEQMVSSHHGTVGDHASHRDDPATRLLMSGKRGYLESMVWQHRSVLPNPDISRGEIRSLEDADLLMKLKSIVHNLTSQK